MKYWIMWPVSVILIALVSTGCSQSDVPNSSNENDSTDYKLVAEVVTDDPTKIQVSYSLTNNTEKDRIVFGIGSQLTSTVIDGDVRLFKGQYDPRITSQFALLITGQILAAGDTISEVAERTVPFIEDWHATNGEPTYNPSEFEFCIGHSDPSDQILPPEGLPSYFLHLVTELSRNECVMLSSQ